MHHLTKYQFLIDLDLVKDRGTPVVELCSCHTIHRCILVVVIYKSFIMISVLEDTFDFITKGKELAS